MIGRDGPTGDAGDSVPPASVQGRDEGGMMARGNWRLSGLRGIPRGALAVAMLALLSACGTGEEVLTGERLDLRAVLSEPGAVGLDVASADLPALRLPEPVAHPDWTHRNGSAQHRLSHPALARNLAALWSVDIGDGNDRKRRITADPVVAGGRVFTLDAGTRVTAVSTGGGVLWSRDLGAALRRSDVVSGGALAHGDGVLYVASALRTLSALDAATGAVIWTQGFDAPVTAAPTVAGDTVYVVAADSSAWAIDTETGRVRWQLPGTPTNAALVGGAGPAVTDRLVIFPFASGEVAAALRRAGVRVWGTTVAGQRRGRAWAGISDITGDPVVVGNTVYVGNQSGRVVALDLRNGERQWTATEAAYSPVWPEGGSVFLVSDEGRLVRLDGADGTLLWAQQLPQFVEGRGVRLNPFRRGPVDRRRAVYAHYGPVLAGGRLVVASGDGVLRFFDPESGAPLSEMPLPRGAASNPVVAGGVLYVVTENGQLHAFR